MAPCASVASSETARRVDHLWTASRTVEAASNGWCWYDICAAAEDRFAVSTGEETVAMWSAKTGVLLDGACFYRVDRIEVAPQPPQTRVRLRELLLARDARSRGRRYRPRARRTARGMRVLREVGGCPTSAPRLALSSWAGTVFVRQFTTRGDRLRCRPIPKARLIPSGTTKPLHGLGATSRWPPRRRSAFSRRTRPPGPPSRTLARRSPLLWRALVKRSGSAERKPPEKTALAPCHVVPELPARNVLVGGA